MVGSFFDYIFYRVSKAYLGTKDSSPEGAAFCIVALMQAFNIISCFMLFALVLQDKSVLNIYLVVGITIFFMVFNYLRYIYKESKNYKLLKEKWGNERNSLKRGSFVAIYIIGTIVLFVGLAIYLGAKKW